MKANFRLIAFDETYGWSGLPEGCTKVYGIYLFREGEATHVCSMTPSSWCEFIENVFIGLETDPLHPFIEEHQYDNGGEFGSYFHYIDPAHLPKRVSDPVEFETDPYDVNDEDGQENKELARDGLWEEAREYVQGNPPYIPHLEEA